MTTEVHSVRFYHPKPCEVKCLASNGDNQLALARTDNTIEIWDITSTPHVERTILDTYGSVEGLAWYENRLFSVGGQGSAIEYDLFRQSPKSMHPLTSGSSSCVAIHKDNKQLAAGTEGGYINLFDITDQGLVYNSLLDKQEGKVQCLAWDPSGKFIVTGSADTVRVWQVSTGHVIHRMTTGRSMNNEETRVWSVVVTSDLTIITGDSRGKLCFWDGKSSVGLASYQSHKADILSVCLTEDEKTVYCAGVDPLISSYEAVTIRGSDGRGKWVKSIHRVIHEHDVRSLIIAGNRLFSAGVDGYLAMSCYPPKVLVKYPPLLQQPAVYTASKAKCLLLRYPRSLVLWRLTSSEPFKLLEWLPSNDSRIRTAAISSNGMWLAVSTQDRFGLFKLNIKDPEITKQQLNIKCSLLSNCVCFSDDCSTLALATNEGDIHVIKLDNKLEIQHSYHPMKKKKMTDLIVHLALSSNGSFVVAADLDCNITIWCKGEFYTKLPRHTSSVTAMSIQPLTDHLFVVHADHKIVEYSINKREYTQFSKSVDENLPAQWLNRSFPVHSITFDSRNDDVVILGDDSTIMVVNKNKPLPETKAKIPRISSGRKSITNDESTEDGNNHPMSTSLTTAFHVIKKYKHLVYFGALAEGEMVAVEINPAKLLEDLPINFKQKQFGNM